MDGRRPVEPVDGAGAPPTAPTGLAGAPPAHSSSTEREGTKSVAGVLPVLEMVFLGINLIGFVHLVGPVYEATEGWPEQARHDAVLLCLRLHAAKLRLVRCARRLDACAAALAELGEG